MLLETDYLGKFFYEDERDELLRLAEKILSDIEFDIIVVRGVSGLLWGTPLAIKMRKGLCVVRKEESTHSCYGVEGIVPEQGDKYIVVDDLIDTGDTIQKIIDSIDSGKFMGAYLCHGSAYFADDSLEYTRPHFWTPYMLNKEKGIVANPEIPEVEMLDANLALPESMLSALTEILKMWREICEAK